VAGGGRAGAGGRARPGGPHPGVPAPSTTEEEEEDDLQIHSEGGAAKLGAPLCPSSVNKKAKPHLFHPCIPQYASLKIIGKE